MSVIGKQLLTLYGFLLLGWLLGRKKPERAGQSELLSVLLVDLFLPCKIFRSFSANFTPAYFRDNGLTVVCSGALLLLLVLLSGPLAARFSRDPYERKVFRYSTVISNYAYMGYVLVEQLLGAAGLNDMTFFCLPFATYAYTAGRAMLTGSGRRLRALLNPMNAALAGGILWGLLGLPVPGAADALLQSASACTGPISMLMTGLILSPYPVRQLLEPRVFAFAGIRLAGLPLLVFGLFGLLGLWLELPAALTRSAVLMACMPCSLSGVIYPRLAGEDCRLGARLVFVSHLCSAVTIPVWLRVLL